MKNERLFRWVSVLSLAITLSTGCGPGQSNTPEPTIDPTTGRITGSIVVKGQPFRDDYIVRLMKITATIDDAPCAASDELGNFNMIQVSPGLYIMMVKLNTTDCNVVLSAGGVSNDVVTDDQGNAVVIEVKAGELVDLKDTVFIR